MKPKLMSFVLPAALVCLAISARPSQAATLVVDDTLACPGAGYQTIQAAVNAANAGDTINVCPGTYNENVTILSYQAGLTLNGAQAGVPITGRTFGNPVNESTVNGQITIKPTNVKFDGFSLTRPAVPAFAAFGIVVGPGADGALIQYNIINNVSTLDITSNGTAQAIYLNNESGGDGPDGVSILHNKISNITSNRSSKGILIGVNGASNPSQNTLIEGNTITNITSDTRGAYGISVANALNVSGLFIRDNSISNLTGTTGWAHAIGLEGDTPGVVVTNNSISNVIAPGTDRIAVWFESNPSFFTAEVHNNNFDLTSDTYGIAVDPALSGGAVDGECNWWGNPFGPGPDGPGFGAKVSPNVDYDPWLTVRNGVVCGTPTSTADAKVNGGGTILVPGGKATFSLEANTKKDGPPQGHLNYQDSAAGIVVKSTAITAVTVTGSHATIYGIATINGTGSYGFVVDVDDNGEPGVGADIFRIQLSSSYTRVNTLNGGNIQVH
jgi:hypothetical protein